jgi:integrase
LNEIERNDIQAWVDEKLAAGYKMYSVRNMLSPLSSSLTLAVDKKILSISPSTKIKFPRPTNRQKDYRPRNEMQQMVKKMNEDDREAILFLGETGLRPSELCGTHADQIQGTVLLVRTVYVPGKNLMRDIPKDLEERIVPLTPIALAIARKRIATRAGGTTCGVPHHENSPCVSDLLFRNHKTGGALTYRDIYEIVKVAAKASGLPHRGGGYAFRRAVATYMGRSGMDLFRIMDIMGWSDAKMARGYIQQSPGAQEEMVRAMTMADNDATQAH